MILVSCFKDPTQMLHWSQPYRTNKAIFVMILNHHHVLCVEVRGVKEVLIKRTIVNCIINKYGRVCIKIYPSSDPNLLFASLVPHLPYVFDFKFEGWLLDSKTEEVHSQLPRYQTTHLISILLLFVNYFLFTCFLLFFLHFLFFVPGKIV